MISLKSADQSVNSIIFIRFIPTAPTIPCTSEMSSVCTQNIVRMKTTKEASTNDEPEGVCVDRKRKFEAISVDTGFKEMVLSDSVFSNSLFSIPLQNAFVFVFFF